ncbi:MAG: hypothetical protein ACOC93_03355, partial [Planctomycetota bacterium]
MLAALPAYLTYLGSTVIVLGSVILAAAIYAIVFLVLSRIAKRTDTQIDDLLAAHLRTPLGAVIGLTTALLALPLARVPEGPRVAVRHAIAVALVLAVFWLLGRAVYVVRDIILNRANVEEIDNRRTRRIHTQMDLLTRVAQILLG